MVAVAVKFRWQAVAEAASGGGVGGVGVGAMEGSRWRRRPARAGLQGQGRPARRGRRVQATVEAGKAARAGGGGVCRRRPACGTPAAEVGTAREGAVSDGGSLYGTRRRDWWWQRLAGCPMAASGRPAWRHMEAGRRRALVQRCPRADGEGLVVGAMEINF